MPRKPTIGLLTPFLGGNYLGDIINCVQKKVMKSGARLIAIRTAGKQFDCPLALDHVDGWIILNIAATDNYLHEIVEHWHKPIVTIAKDLAVINVNGHMITCDNEGGIIEAFRHLYEHGHRSIGFVTHLGLDDMKLRLNGYLKALGLFELPYIADHIIDPGDHGVHGGRMAADKIVEDGFPFTAAVVGTDMIAIGMIERFTELGYRIPEDFAIIGFDNTESTSTYKPSISSVDQNIEQAATLAVDLLLSRLGIPLTSTIQHTIDCTLIHRQSCGCSPATNKDMLTQQMIEDYKAEKNRMTQVGVHYEFDKFILNYNIDKISDLSWALAPHLHWSCLGLWSDTAQNSSNIKISELYHFHKNKDFKTEDSFDIKQFPPFELLGSEIPEEHSDMIYIIPYRTLQNNWSVLAVGTSLTNTVDELSNYMTVIHYLDLIASTLDRQALLAEAREQSKKYRLIAEQLEIVSRTSNDGIWDMNLITGEVIWNQRFYDLLNTKSVQSFDALLHIDDLVIFQSVVKIHIDKHTPFMIDARLRKQPGHYVWVAISGECVFDSEGVPIRLVGSVSDITERKQAEEKMRYLAYHDTLTGLTNRRRFYEEIASAASDYKQQFAIMVLDLDHFKKINDSFGHQMGDRLLQLVADGLKHLVRLNDHISRFGGDEFVILYQFSDIDEVEAFAASISSHLSTLLLDEGVNLTITMSAGISVFPKDGADPDTLIKKADIAMYKVKQNGKNDFEIFSPQMIEQTMWRLNTENELKNAIANEQFMLYYQPQIHIESGELYGVEALLRWNSPTQGIISPLTFIPLAEETGLILQIGDWVIREACRQSVQWLKQGCKPFKMSVNLSGRQLRQANFVDSVKQIIETTGMDPHYLCIEITESTVIDDLDSTINMFKELSELGIQTSMDDFGTGYSSLSVLKKLPLNMLKIDKSFIREMTYEHKDFDIVKAIISISNSLKLQIVAEGVEQKEQYDLLQELGCHFIQGYFISRPLPADQFETMLDFNSAIC